MRASERMRTMKRNTEESKACRKCLRVLPITDFRFQNKAKNKRNNICRECRQIHRKFLREAQIDYDVLLAKQNNACAICGISNEETSRGLVIDHNHETMSVRGLLCFPCNSGLAFFQESPTLLAMAVEYLVKHDGITS